MKNLKGPKILFLDIETSPIEAYVWGLHDQNVALNQMKSDWRIISAAWKWSGFKSVYQFDESSTSEKTTLFALKRALDTADVVVTQNGKSFDIRKIYARFLAHGMKKPSSFQHIDVYREAKKLFGFTSHKLEYMSEKFCKKHVKRKHKRFPGFELWTECLKGNKLAWREMAEYNKADVLALEELYYVIMEYAQPINFSVFYNDGKTHCSGVYKGKPCKSTEFNDNGWSYGSEGRRKRYECKKCGKEMSAKRNVAKHKLRRGT